MATIRELQTIVPRALLAGVSVEIKSSPGTGKTVFSHSLPELMQKLTGHEYKMAEIFCPNYEYSDLAGLQFKKEVDHNGERVSVADPTVPYWAILEDGSFIWDHPHGVIVLEEIGQAGAEVRKTLANLRLEKRINKWQLPKGWHVIALSNRSSDRSGVTKEFDHEINRRIEFTLDANVDDWADWADHNGVHPLLINFAQVNPHIVFSGEVPEKQGPYCTPRSLALLNKVLLQFTDSMETLPTDKLAHEVMIGLIGESAAAQLISTVRLANEMPSFKEIVNDPDNAHVPPPERPDAQMLVCYRLASMIDDKSFPNAMRYLKRFPAEFSMTFLKSAVARNPRLVSTQVFSDWSVDNRDLVESLISIN